VTAKAAITIKNQSEASSIQTDRDDVSVGITIALVTAAAAKASIEAVRHPPSAGAYSAVHIETDLKNVGTAAGKLFAYVKDRDTGSVAGLLTYTDTLPIGSTATLAWDPVMPNKDWHLQIVAGHAATPNDIVDDTSDFDITLETTPYPDIDIYGISYPAYTTRGNTVGLMMQIRNTGSKGCIAYGQWHVLQPPQGADSLTDRRTISLNPGESASLGPWYLTVPDYGIGPYTWKLRAVAGYMLSQPPEPPEPVQTDYYDTDDIPVS